MSLPRFLSIYKKITFGVALIIGGALVVFIVLFGYVFEKTLDAEKSNAAAEVMFRYVLFNPIPDGARAIQGSGELRQGHNIYLKFGVDDDVLEKLITFRTYENVPCEQVQERLVLPDKFKTDIPTWKPEIGAASTCYVSRQSYKNEWTASANSVFLVESDNVVYFNEVGI